MAFPSPSPGASLLVTFKPKNTLIIGSGSLAASRAFAALEADSAVVILAKADHLCDELKYRIQQKQISFIDWPDSLQSALSDVDLVCITDTVAGTNDRRSSESAEQIYHICRAMNVLVNTADMPELCDISFASTHRFGDSTLQVGVTTNGQGCRIAGRLKRDIVSRLPKDVGKAVQNLGRLRTLAKGGHKVDDDFDESLPTPNRPVPQRQITDPETVLERTKRRMKWVAQISEYWPISKLASLSQSDMTNVLAGEISSPPSSESPLPPSVHDISFPPQGRIILAGSGPGHPSLLTLAAHTALTKTADLVLSDKLVPEGVLTFIPSTVQVRIAKKFPGNAEGAQIEMMEAAVEAAKRGLTVVRLKQGDPAVYGRAGEEILYFREHGFEPVVIPGVSSALAAPLFAGIPVTQRGAAESFIVCTGVGKGGKDVKLPGYERSRTLVLLMGVARLEKVIQVLTDPAVCKEKRSGEAYPTHTPIALIERGSMPDQRVISSTLTDIVQALESVGEQRPPGMIVIGWAVPSLWGKGQVNVLDRAELEDDARVSEWLDCARWRISEGVPEFYI